MDTLQEHWETVNGLQKEFLNERDRRYSEVKAAEEKALIIKQQADEKALDLADEIQKYKDEKANQLREQINSERGAYPTKEELRSAIRELNASIAPLTAFVTSQTGQREYVNQQQQNTKTLTSILLTIIGALSLMVMVFGALGGVFLFRH